MDLRGVDYPRPGASGGYEKDPSGKPEIYIWNQGNRTYTQPQLVAHYLRTYLSTRYDDARFDVVSGPVNHEFTAYCDSSAGRPDAATLRDPQTGLLNDIQHLGASLGSVFHNSLHSSVEEVSLVDFGGWAGDLITAAVDTYRSGVTDENAYTYAYGQIGNSAAQGTFPGVDLIADVDAMVFGLAIQSGRSPRLSSEVQQYYATADAGRSKYAAFVSDRFHTRESFLAASRAVFTQTSDFNFSIARGGLWQDSVDWVDLPIGGALGLHPQLFEGVASAFVNVVYDKYIN